MTVPAYDASPRPLLVPCTQGAPHVFHRPADCTTCGGTGQRPAEDVEYVYCDGPGHEHELRDGQTYHPELEGRAPAHDDNGTGAVWDCTYARCGGAIILSRAAA